MFLTDEGCFVSEYADCLHQIGKNDSARILLETHKALLNDPADLTIIAQIYEAGDDLRQAEKYLKQAMWHSPKRIHAPNMLADFYFLHDQIARGIDLAHYTLENNRKLFRPKPSKYNANCSKSLKIIPQNSYLYKDSISDSQD